MEKKCIIGVIPDQLINHCNMHHHKQKLELTFAKSHIKKNLFRWNGQNFAKKVSMNRT